MMYSRPYRFAFSSLFWVLVGWMQLLCVCCVLFLGGFKPSNLLGESSSSYFTISSNTFDLQSRTSTVSKCLPPWLLACFRRRPADPLTTYPPNLPPTSLRIPTVKDLDWTRLPTSYFYFSVSIVSVVYHIQNLLQLQKHDIHSFIFPHPSSSTHLFRFHELATYCPPYHLIPVSSFLITCLHHEIIHS